MAHFAEIDSNNIVTRVLVIPDEEAHRGQEYLSQDLGLGGTWLQTSYNTHYNKHIYGGTPLRGNFASAGHSYDPNYDVFLLPKPFPSWVLDTETFDWIPPVPHPEGRYTNYHEWDEENQLWKEPSNS
jgi:hypothetical protein